MGEPSFQLACFPDDPDHLSKLFQKKRQLRFREDEFRLPLPSTFYQEEKWEVSKALGTFKYRSSLTTIQFSSPTFEYQSYRQLVSHYTNFIFYIFTAF